MSSSHGELYGLRFRAGSSQNASECDPMVTVNLDSLLLSRLSFFPFSFPKCSSC